MQPFPALPAAWTEGQLFDEEKIRSIRRANEYLSRLLNVNSESTDELRQVIDDHEMHNRIGDLIYFEYRHKNEELRGILNQIHTTMVSLRQVYDRRRHEDYIRRLAEMIEYTAVPEEIQGLIERVRSSSPELAAIPQFVRGTKAQLVEYINNFRDRLNFREREPLIRYILYGLGRKKKSTRTKKRKSTINRKRGKKRSMYYKK
jgi:hypothetical protein